MFSILIRPILGSRLPAAASSRTLPSSVRHRVRMHWERAGLRTLIARWLPSD